jgi:hypothetical protein
VDGPDRAAVVRRLAALEGEGRLGAEQVRLAAGGMKVSERTVWRWVRQARAGEGLDRRPRERFQVTDDSTVNGTPSSSTSATIRSMTAATHRASRVQKTERCSGADGPVVTSPQLVRRSGPGRADPVAELPSGAAQRALNARTACP